MMHAGAHQLTAAVDRSILYVCIYSPISYFMCDKTMELMAVPSPKMRSKPRKPPPRAPQVWAHVQGMTLWAPTSADRQATVETCRPKTRAFKRAKTRWPSYARLPVETRWYCPACHMKALELSLLSVLMKIRFSRYAPHRSVCSPAGLQNRLLPADGHGAVKRVRHSQPCFCYGASYVICKQPKFCSLSSWCQRR